MATRTYKLPTVNAAGKMSFPDAVNGLATGVDYAMRGVQKSFGDPDDYKLPVATSSTLGGVRIGDGFKVFADGEIQPEKSEFVLKPATASALGGVAIGKNVDVDDAGKIIAGAGAFQSTNITESELAFGAVTGDKFRDGTILQEDLESSLINKILAPAQLWGNAKRYEIFAQPNDQLFIDSLYLIEFKKGVFLVLGHKSRSGGIYDKFISDFEPNAKKTYDLFYSGGSQIPAETFGTNAIEIVTPRVGTDADKSLKTFGYNVLKLDFKKSKATQIFYRTRTGGSNYYWDFTPVFVSEKFKE